jgi:hypothetical protein
MIAVRAEDLQAGCLTNPYGGPRRRVWYLDELLHDIEDLDAQLYWRLLPPGMQACSDLGRRFIYLAPALFSRGPVRVRFAICHELTHIRHGRTSDDWVLFRQWERYGHLLFPEYLAA